MGIIGVSENSAVIVLCCSLHYVSDYELRELACIAIAL